MTTDANITAISTEIKSSNRTGPPSQVRAAAGSISLDLGCPLDLQGKPAGQGLGAGHPGREGHQGQRPFQGACRADQLAEVGAGLAGGVCQGHGQQDHQHQQQPVLQVGSAQGFVPLENLDLPGEGDFVQRVPESARRGRGSRTPSGPGWPPPAAGSQTGTGTTENQAADHRLRAPMGQRAAPLGRNSS